MPVIDQKGKKRAMSDTPEGSMCEEEDLEQRKPKKSKKAETRVCPVCQDTIPVRLLATHEVFELQRVEDICQSRPADGDLLPWEQIEKDLFSAGPSKRSAAVRARRSLNPGQGSNTASGKPSLSTQVSKTIKTVQRHRRERHIKLKDLLRTDIDEDEGIATASGSMCPVCQTTVPGDPDFVEAHIDACLRHAAAENDDNLAADGLEVYDIGGETRIRIARSVNFRGAGYNVRNPQEIDIEDDIDIDGDDAALFGEAQFTEADIIRSHQDPESIEADIHAEHQRPEHGGLLPMGKVQGSSSTSELTQNAGKTASHDSTPDSSVPGGVACRICLDSYTEPTISTGCWHTCCKACWLRCLGSTKLCPMCKRITIAGELRRIYL